jgi:protocatechuate 3,4-dioxygenase beta subunit
VSAQDLAAGSFAEPHDVTTRDGETAEVDLELAHSASVAGIVVDQTGAPVPDVYVSLVAGDDGGSAATDAAGAFRIRSLAGGRDYTASVYPFAETDVGAFAGRLSPIHVPDARAEVTGVRLVIDHARLDIRGTVVDEHGAPAPDVRVEIAGLFSDRDPPPDALMSLLPVTLQPNPGVLSPQPTAVTDAAGGFVLRGLSAARYDLRARASDGGDVRANDIAAGSTNVVITLPASGAIDGELVGFGPDASVVASDHRDTLRAAAIAGGHYSVHGLRAGRYSIRARDGAGADARTVDVVAGSTTQADLRSHGAGRIEGRVVELGSGAPVGGARCVASAAMNGFAPWWDGDAAATTRDDGRFSLDPAPAGRTRVICMGTATTSRAQRDADVPVAGATAIQIEVVHTANRGGVAGFTMFDDQLPPTVVGILPDGPAARAGLAIGDQIASIDGASTDDFGAGGTAALIANHAPGSTVVLGVIRHGVRSTVSLVLR